MMQSKESVSYARPLAERVDESEEDLESLEVIESKHRLWEYSEGRKKLWVLAGTAAVLIISNLISARVGAHVGSSRAKLNSVCAAHTTQWSPVLKEVDVKYDWKSFNGSFLEEDVYRQQGSPEVDAAWEALGVDYRAGVISIEDGLKSGLDMSFVRRSEKYGAGFFVNVEGMHHLHCLNLVRKALFFNYDYYKKLGTHAFKNDDNIVKVHVSHCLDTVRQVLMCNFDTGVLGQVWANDPPQPFPDFHTKHMCKNYEELRQWAEDLQAPLAETLPNDYSVPPQPEWVIPHTP
ncbi:tat pathway signal sequence [Colletotrichum truncatum]|uniref:Tat pathway signal sequence n=1 Tax=Colletotrichum truncatum TaxID=5467 RepID=A0ACC3ZGB5_COLTU|nr:tat pathway signal sequence [Colletotrichum truncatum]KAF6784656.1 tat pathway signal sequence [Colletotrichum truncatum]